MAPSPDAGTPPTTTVAIKARSGLKFTLDGLSNDWEEQNVKPLWQEAGAVGPGGFKSNVDIQQVRFSNDDEFLYAFLQTNPSITARYKDHEESGELCELFFDIDDNPKTGCKDVNGFDYGMITGYEMKAWIPLGVFSGPSGIGPFVSYDLTAAQDGKFGLEAVESQSSQQDQSLISHGDQGVELAIPLKTLGAKPGDKIRLLLKESVDPFAKERYSEGVYVLQDAN